MAIDMRPALKSWRLRVGDLVEVRSLQEIVATLDNTGCLDGMPFMPEMAAYCGKRMRVDKIAHKTCDTIDGVGAREIDGAVHLVGARCDGGAHGGCQAACLLFWKLEWLGPVHAVDRGTTVQGIPMVKLNPQWVYQPSALTAASTTSASPVRYRCQATEAFKYSRPLAWWKPGQYIKDIRSGNVSLGVFLEGLYAAAYRNLLGLGFGYRAMVSLYNRIQSWRGRCLHPYVAGTQTKTPVEALDLAPGDWVRIKPFYAIVDTLDSKNKNRGLWFVPQEMGNFCGRVGQVSRRIERIINERSGEMIEMKTPSVVIDNVVCSGINAPNRMYCPRAATLYWREIWLERTSPPDRHTAP
jgi:hypothetical protein